MKKILAVLALGVLVGTAAHATVKAVDVSGPASSGIDAKWKGYLLTWQTPNDSTTVAVLGDTTAADEDTSNTFTVSGLFKANPKDTVGVLFFRCVSDTTIDSLRYILDYSFDDATWKTGTYTAYFAGANNAAGTDTTFSHYVLGNPSVGQGGQIFAPYWRLRAGIPIQQRGAGGPNSDKKLKQLTVNFFAGGR